MPEVKSETGLDVKALRKAMIDADCSTRELAAACEISPSTLYRRLNGQVCFTLGEIMKAAKRLNLSRSEYMRIFLCKESFPKETYSMRQPPK